MFYFVQTYAGKVCMLAGWRPRDEAPPGVTADEAAGGREIRIPGEDIMPSVRLMESWSNTQKPARDPASGSWSVFQGWPLSSSSGWPVHRPLKRINIKHGARSWMNVASVRSAM